MDKKPFAAHTDEELIAEFQQENLAAFDEIVRRYRDPLYNFVVRLLGDTLFSEDVVQETFVRVYRNKHRYHQVAKFSTWIYTIASNLAKTELRRRKVRNFFSISSKGNDERDYDIVDQHTDVEREVDGRVRTELILRAIEKLPYHFREAVLLRDVQDLSYEEISEVLKVPLGTVKSRVNRGRTRLQEALKFLENEESDRG
ncbi:MAG: sigma-70 family RNA polymerase sigma factor [Calditrichaeota bacterium]|nr:sigma-70 family RNA polymerase sigma factor [Calditrichota bacterium]MCB9366349.1 sigma-70 family RNA polymerase sigma factor [Calditrichota bacterium]